VRFVAQPCEQEQLRRILPQHHRVAPPQHEDALGAPHHWRFAAIRLEFAGLGQPHHVQMGDAHIPHRCVGRRQLALPPVDDQQVR
jgi:hypothetical protein